MADKPSHLRTILIADHEVETRTLVAAVLQKAGYDVVEADSGDDVVDAARREPPRLVILEVTLPARETEVLRLLAQGLEQEDIAGQLFITRRTVGTHIENLTRKLGVRSRAQAVALAYREDLVKSS